MMYISGACVMLLSMIQGGFTIADDGAGLTVFENDKPVLTYQYQPGELPDRVGERYRRSGYVHPLYGLDGEVMTQDFPLDHFHHRGVFWAWPDSTLGDRKVDIWALDGARQVHAGWIEKRADENQAVIAAVNNWVFDDAPDVPIIREEIKIVVHPSSDTSRNIDFDLTFTNVTAEEFVLRGSGTDNKGYGGFCLRPDATRKPFTFTSLAGASTDEDVTDEALPSPWVDVSFAREAGADPVSGVAIFQHPDNPGYPHPGWILRHYGFLGQSWPHIHPYPMQPGVSLRLRYCLHVHRGDAEASAVAAAFQQYEEEMK